MSSSKESSSTLRNNTVRLERSTWACTHARTRTHARAHTCLFLWASGSNGVCWCQARPHSTNKHKQTFIPPLFSPVTFFFNFFRFLMTQVLPTRRISRSNYVQWVAPSAKIKCRAMPETPCRKCLPRCMAIAASRDRLWPRRGLCFIFHFSQLQLG